MGILFPLIVIKIAYGIRYHELGIVRAWICWFWCLIKCWRSWSRSSRGGGGGGGMALLQVMGFKVFDETVNCHKSNDCGFSKVAFHAIKNKICSTISRLLIPL